MTGRRGAASQAVAGLATEHIFSNYNIFQHLSYLMRLIRLKGVNYLRKTI
jgi:hypothetical protein